MIELKYDPETNEARIGGKVYCGPDVLCARCNSVIEFESDRFGFIEYDVIAGIGGDHTSWEQLLCDNCQREFRAVYEDFLDNGGF